MKYIISFLIGLFFVQFAHASTAKYEISGKMNGKTISIKLSFDKDHPSIYEYQTGKFNIPNAVVEVKAGAETFNFQSVNLELSKSNQYSTITFETNSPPSYFKFSGVARNDSLTFISPKNFKNTSTTLYAGQMFSYESAINGTLSPQYRKLLVATNGSSVDPSSKYTLGIEGDIRGSNVSIEMEYSVSDVKNVNLPTGTVFNIPGAKLTAVNNGKTHTVTGAEVQLNNSGSFTIRALNSTAFFNVTGNKQSSGILDLTQGKNERVTLSNANVDIWQSSYPYFNLFGYFTPHLAKTMSLNETGQCSKTNMIKYEFTGDVNNQKFKFSVSYKPSELQTAYSPHFPYEAPKAIVEIEKGSQKSKLTGARISFSQSPDGGSMIRFEEIQSPFGPINQFRFFSLNKQSAGLDPKFDVTANDSSIDSYFSVYLNDNNWFENRGVTGTSLKKTSSTETCL
jgi:hypothetical protein